MIYRFCLKRVIAAILIGPLTYVQFSINTAAAAPIEFAAAPPPQSRIAEARTRLVDVLRIVHALKSTDDQTTFSQALSGLDASWLRASRALDLAEIDIGDRMSRARGSSARRASRIASMRERYSS